MRERSREEIDVCKKPEVAEKVLTEGSRDDRDGAVFRCAGATERRVVVKRLLGREGGGGGRTSIWILTRGMY